MRLFMRQGSWDCLRENCLAMKTAFLSSYLLSRPQQLMQKMCNCSKSSTCPVTDRRSDDFTLTASRSQIKQNNKFKHKTLFRFSLRFLFSWWVSSSHQRFHLMLFCSVIFTSTFPWSFLKYVTAQAWMNTDTHTHNRLQEAGVFTCLQEGIDEGRAGKVREHRKKKKSGRQPDLKRGDSRETTSS